MRLDTPAGKERRVVRYRGHQGLGQRGFNGTTLELLNRAEVVRLPGVRTNRLVQVNRTGSEGQGQEQKQRRYHSGGPASRMHQSVVDACVHDWDSTTRTADRSSR